MTTENFDPNDEIFFCHHDKAWRRKNGCRFRMEIKIDDCTPECKQAIKEGVTLPTIIKLRRKEK